jgi:hypothetical protein
VRRGGTGAVGVGCIEEEWTGADRAIRDALFVDLDTDAPRALVPHSLVRLRPTSGEIERSRVDRGDCDARDAVVRVHATTPGERRAEVQSAHPVDVVLRSTYLPTWEVRVDGRRETPVLVAPGFLAVRVAAGTHRIEARVAPLPFYVAGLCLAALALALLVWREQKMQPLRS